MKQKKITPARIYHPWWTWECYKAGFYNSSPPDGLTPEQASEKYRDFLRDLNAFGNAMFRVMLEWPHSCEHFLTNPSLNRIAWLGQASMCIAHGVPSCFRGGFKLLTPEEQNAADALAEEYLEMWLEDKCRQQPKSVNT
jgi:hypothetical protein